MLPLLLWCEGTSSFITVPTARAIEAAAGAAAEFDQVPEGRHDEWPEHMVKLLSEEGPLRKELVEFAMGQVSPTTNQRQPLRHWEALATHLSNFSEF